MAKSEEFIVSGAKMYCPYGSIESYLVVSLSHGYFIGGLPVAHYEDCVPGFNIKPFGYCDRRKGLCQLDKLANRFTNYSKADVISTEYGVAKMIKDTKINILLALDERRDSFDQLLQTIIESRKGKNDEHDEYKKTWEHKINELKEQDNIIRKLANALLYSQEEKFKEILVACTNSQNKFVALKQELQSSLADNTRAEAIQIAIESGTKTLDNILKQNLKEISISDIGNDLDRNMSFIISQINYISKIQKPSRYFMINKLSTLQCGYGANPIKFITTGQEDYDLIEEKIHVLIFMNEEDGYPQEYIKKASAVRFKSSDSIVPPVGDNQELNDIVSERIIRYFDTKKYRDHPYSGTSFANYLVELYLPCVFPGFKTARRLSSDMTKTRQIDSQLKIIQHNRYIETCVKLYYMTLFGGHVRLQYWQDYIAYNCARGVGDPRRYLHAMTHSSYGMWGKWYDPDNGWHRGIDIEAGEAYSKTEVDSNGTTQKKVFAIADGKLVGALYNYYFNVFYDDGDIGYTITYMHNIRHANTVSKINQINNTKIKDSETEVGLFEFEKKVYEAYCEYALAVINANKKEAELEELKSKYLKLLRDILPSLPNIKTGECIAYLGKMSTKFEHEHIEFNKGFFLGEIKRPDASDDSYNVTDIDTVIESYPKCQEGEPHAHEFSSRPYDYIEELFNIHDDNIEEDSTGG